MKANREKILKEMGEMYREGKSVKEIAETYNYKESTVRSMLNEGGYKRDNKVKEEFLNEVTKLYVEYNMSVSKIAEKLGKPKNIIRNLIQNNDIKKKEDRVNILKDIIINEYGELYKEGKMSCGEILIKLTVDHNLECANSTILKILNNNGFKREQQEPKEKVVHKSRDDYNKERREKRDKLYESIWKDYTELDMSKEELSEKYGLCLNTIKSYLSKCKKKEISSTPIQNKQKENKISIVTHSNNEHRIDINDKPYLPLDGNKVLYNGRVYELLKGKKLRRELLKALNVAE